MIVRIFKERLLGPAVFQKYSVQPIVRTAVRRLNNKLNIRNMRKELTIPFCCLTFIGNVPVKILHLGTTQCGVDIRHTVIVANMIMNKGPTVRNFGLGCQMFGKLAQLFVLEKQHTPTTGGDRFITIKTDGSHSSESTRMTAFIETTDTFGRILDKFYMIFVAHCRQFVNLHRMPERMHRNTSLDTASRLLIITLPIPYFRMPRQPSFYSKRRKPQSISIHIKKYRMCTNITDGVTGSDKSKSLS